MSRHKGGGNFLLLGRGDGHRRVVVGVEVRSSSRGPRGLRKAAADGKRVARSRAWASVGVAIERKRDEDDSRRLRNVREEKPRFPGSQSAGRRPTKSDAREKKKDLNVKAPGQNVFVDASPPRIFRQNWQPDQKASARTGILGFRWVKKCVGDPTQHQFCTENLGISRQNGLRTYWDSRISHEKNKPGNLPSCYSSSEARPTRTSHVSISRFPLRRLREFWSDSKIPLVV